MIRGNILSFVVQENTRGNVQSWNDKGNTVGAGYAKSSFQNGIARARDIVIDEIQ